MAYWLCLGPWGIRETTQDVRMLAPILQTANRFPGLSHLEILILGPRAQCVCPSGGILEPTEQV